MKYELLAVNGKAKLWRDLDDENFLKITYSGRNRGIYTDQEFAEWAFEMTTNCPVCLSAELVTCPSCATAMDARSATRMNQVNELVDKVIYYKGRVWTVYAITGNQDGVFIYQGLKPYSTFQFDSYSSNRNTSYLKLQEALDCIIEGVQITECVKNEKKAESKKLNKKLAVDFFVYLTGHAKSKINSEIVEEYNAGFKIVLGQVRYDLWKMDGRLHLHYNMHGNTTGTTFDFVTWKHDSNYEDRQLRESRREEAKSIIEDYKQKYRCSCDNDAK